MVLNVFVGIKSCAVTTCDNCARLALEIELLKLERTKPKLAVSHFGVERLAADEVQCKYYTSLPSYAVFKSLFNAPTPHLHEVHKSSNADTQPGRERRLSMADELFMVLMGLRMGLQVKDLMYRFGFSSASHISTIFWRWILFLAKHLSPLIAWRSRKRVKNTYPRCSEQQKMTSVRGILDCTEYEIEAPSSLSLNSMTYSDYKGRNTVKVLSRITPDGFISFVSMAYPGSISDNAITVKSGILDMALPGDTFMVDKGFTLSNAELQPRGLTLVVPPCRKHNEQFSASAVRKTRTIAAMRITVENCIARVNYARILKRHLPVKTLDVASAIVRVSAVLANFRPALRK